MLLCKPVLLGVKNEARRRSFTQNREDLKNVQVENILFSVAMKTLELL